MTFFYIICSFVFPISRLRRKRSSVWIRSLCGENVLSVNDLVLPLFVHSGLNNEESPSGLPNMTRYSVDGIAKIVKVAKSLGINAVVVFPVIDNSLKTNDAAEAFNPNGLICNAIKSIKSAVPDIGIIADVALDPYLPHGHDGLLDEYGIVSNDDTIPALCTQAVVLAAAGCDVIAPSDMMDGRIIAIRNTLDKCNFANIPILSYSVKYCSGFYSPFRSAVGSNQENNVSIDKSTYHMDIANSNEAVLEVQYDIEEGADFVIIKPAGCFLDIIYRISNIVNIPVFGYHVSGEYAMIVAASERGFVDYKKAIMETTISIKRAGASCIFTYAALDIARQL